MASKLRCFMCGDARTDLKQGYLAATETCLAPVAVCMKCLDVATREGRAEHDIVDGSLGVVFYDAVKLV